MKKRANLKQKYRRPFKYADLFPDKASKIILLRKRPRSICIVCNINIPQTFLKNQLLLKMCKFIELFVLFLKLFNVA